MVYDVAIIGGGPAGITNAIYCARAGKSVVVIEKVAVGGMIIESPSVRNIPGFVDISGADFAIQLEEQALACGVEIQYAEVTDVKKDDGLFHIILSDGSEIVSIACVVACGTKHRTLGLPHEEEFIGKGVHFCATCDGPLYKDKPVIVVGGGNSAVTEAIELSGMCCWVTIAQDLSDLTAEQALIDRLDELKNVSVWVDCHIKEYRIYEGKIVGLRFEDDLGSSHDFHGDAVFLAIGLIPQAKEILKSVYSEELIDGYGNIITKNSGETLVSGLFACGDCKNGAMRQVATACGDGAFISRAVIDYVEKTKH